MNPYNRFSIVANAVSAAIVLATAAVVAEPALQAMKAAPQAGSIATLVAGGVGLTVTIVVWLALTHAILPFFFRYTALRRLILGKHYMEGTWIQAEKHDGAPRMAVIEIQPNGTDFRFSGYAVDDSLDVQSNLALEFSRFDWPFMTYKFRNSLADSADEGREGVGEIHFEANRHAPRSYNGFVQTVNRVGRVKIEGVRLNKGLEIRDLRSLEHRAKVIDKYWGLFFERGDRATRLGRNKIKGADASMTAQAATVAAPVQSPSVAAKEAAPEPMMSPSSGMSAREPRIDTFVTENAARTPDGKQVRMEMPMEDRRDPRSEPVTQGPVVPRRRAEDWSKAELDTKLFDGDLAFPSDRPGPGAPVSGAPASGASVRGNKVSGE